VVHALVEFEMLAVVNLSEKLARFDALWSPKIVAELDATHVKVAKVHGEFVWHAHADEDELFWVLRGRLRIELRDGAITLGPGELVVVPKGVEHRPVAEEEVHLVLIERAGILHTGGVADARAVSEYERI
jgi:mannose-6-phosphate isomerase-like protein (cupin superfamily)